MSDVEARLDALERAVAGLTRTLEQRAEAREAEPRERGAAPTDESDRLWMLEGLMRRHPEGAVGFAGHVHTPEGDAHWQWGRLTSDLLTEDWGEAATALAALGHPVRLQLLRLVATGTTTTAALTEAEGLGTTGQLHHHLRALVAAGWLASTGRGRYRIQPHRAIPLLVVLSATLPT